MEYKVKLDNFEGSLDLLYHLIKRAEVEIWEISLAEITRQYLEYLQIMDELNIEVASNFLVMAATLLRLKSRMLLPVKEEEDEAEEEDMLAINTKEELFQKVLQHRFYKEISLWLKEKEKEEKKIFLRPQYENKKKRIIVITQDEDLYPYSADLLQEIWLEMQERNKRKFPVPSFKIPEVFHFKKKVKQILFYLRKQGEAYFHLLYPRGSPKKEIIHSFLAILELAHRKQVFLRQRILFGNILIKKDKG